MPVVSVVAPSGSKVTVVVGPADGTEEVSVVVDPEQTSMSKAKGPGDPEQTKTSKAKGSGHPEQTNTSKRAREKPRFFKLKGDKTKHTWHNDLDCQYVRHFYDRDMEDFVGDEANKEFWCKGPKCTATMASWGLA